MTELLIRISLFCPKVNVKKLLVTRLRVLSFRNIINFDMRNVSNTEVINFIQFMNQIKPLGTCQKSVLIRMKIQ